MFRTIFKLNRSIAMNRLNLNSMRFQGPVRMFSQDEKLNEEKEKPYTGSTQKYMFEHQINDVLGKLKLSKLYIERNNDEDPRLKQLQDDIERIETQFQKLVFWEDDFPLDTLTDEDWIRNERKRELDMKKLLTVTKSKFYMIKINYSKIFKEVDFYNMSERQLAPEAKEFQAEERLFKDLKRSDVDKDAKDKAKQDLINRLRKPINISESFENLNSKENVEKRKKVLENDKILKAGVDSMSKVLIEEMEVFKDIDKIYKESGYAENFRKQKYVQREEDPELKVLFEKEVERMKNMSSEMESQIDGEIDMDLHGNINIRYQGEKGRHFDKPEEDKSLVNEYVNKLNIKEDDEAAKPTGMNKAGTYVLRDGKLVEGEGEERVKSEFSNWYCSNADPEDIRKHRELMDRMHYRGPKWDEIGIPKSVLEEENPIYRKRDKEEHPMIANPELEGEKAFETVVR